MLSSIRHDSKHFKTSSSTNNFDEELRLFTEMLSMINEKFANSVENNNSHEFCSIMKELVELQKDLTESGLLSQSSMSAEIKLAQIEELQRSASETTLIYHQRASNEEYLERLISKCDNKTAKHQTENIQEEAIFIKFNRKFLEQTYEPIQHAENSKQVDKSRSNNQKHVISDTTLKDIKQREFNILEQERKIQEIVFSRIYHRYTGKKSQAPPVSTLESISKTQIRNLCCETDCLPDSDCPTSTEFGSTIFQTETQTSQASSATALQPDSNCSELIILQTTSPE